MFIKYGISKNIPKTILILNLNYVLIDFAAPNYMLKYALKNTF